MKKTITPVVLAVIQKGDSFLLTKRVEHDKEESQLEFNELWQLPGGGLEFGESVEEGVIRECSEELGSKIHVITLLPKLFHRVYENHWHGLLIPFLCKLESPESKITLNHEASEWGWFTKKEIEKMNTFPFIKPIIRLI